MTSASPCPALPPRLVETLHRHDETLGDGWDPTTTMGPRAASEAPATLPRLGLAGETAATPEYRLGEPLGRGATAVVYAAEQVPLGRTVAIKALRPERQGAAAEAALVDEARIACLEHPNIVPVHAVGLDASGRPLLVMKRVEGEPWQRVMAEPGHALWRRWPGDAIDRALAVTLRVADALSAAHHAGVLHRDVKPSNVVLGERGEVYLVDWGIAARLGDDGRLVAPLAGTPAYMAPEMFDEVRALDRRSDVYLLGATLYAALAGRPPRQGRTLAALAVAAARGPAPIAGVPDELWAVVARAMEPDPAGRFADVEALRAALVEFIDHRAALAWVVRADARRARLADEALAIEARDRLLAEALFGYRSALDAWAGCAAARAGIEALVEAVVRVDLARGDVAAARRALAELPGERVDLRAAVQAAEAREAAERVELDAARARAAGLDVDGGRRRRRRWVPAIVLLLVVGPIRAGVMRLVGALAPDETHLARGVAPLLIAAAVEVYLRRRAAGARGAVFNRRLVRLVQVLLVASAVGWTRAALGQIGVAEAVCDVLAMHAAAAAVAAGLLDRRLGVMALSAGAGLGVAAAAPLAGELALGLHFVGAVLILEWAWSDDGVSGARAESSGA